MESRVIKLYDYHQLDLSAYKQRFLVDEQMIQKEWKNLQNKHSEWEEGNAACNGDIVICNLSSERAKFQRRKIKLVVGSGMFHKELEQELVGMRKGQEKTAILKLEDDRTEVEIQVLDIWHRKVPEVTDALAKESGIEGVHTVEAFRDYYVGRQKKEFLEKMEYPALDYAVHAVFDGSDILIKKRDWEEAVLMELEKYRELSRRDGLTLEEMTEQDFDGKIPVKSYDQLLCMVQDQNWESLMAYAVGKEYAKERGGEPTPEEYEKEMAEYASFWRCTVGEAKKITGYPYFSFTWYINLFYRVLTDYVEEQILVEGENEDGDYLCGK